MVVWINEVTQAIESSSNTFFIAVQIMDNYLRRNPQSV